MGLSHPVEEPRLKGQCDVGLFALFGYYVSMTFRLCVLIVGPKRFCPVVMTPNKLKETRFQGPRLYPAIDLYFSECVCVSGWVGG